MPVDENIRKLLAKTEVFLHPDAFTIVSIDRMHEEKARRLLQDLKAFSSITFDLAEVSLVVKAGEWAGLREGFDDYEEEGPYRLITFDIVLDLSIVGFLATVSDRLAEEGISIYALSTFLRDHILIRSEDAERAFEALQGLIDRCKEE